MTQSQHTPEKFYITTDKTADGATMICVCRENPSAINDNQPERPLVVWQAYESPENWVIARLIAAAPDLLAALKKLVDYTTYLEKEVDRLNGIKYCGEGGSVDNAREAIQKAEA